MIKKTAEKSKNKKNKQDITGKIAPKKGKKTRTTEKKKEYALKKIRESHVGKMKSLNRF